MQMIPFGLMNLTFGKLKKSFCQLLEDFLPSHTLSKELLRIEMQNLSLYGYGIKGFMLSMIETAISVSDRTIDVKGIEK